MFNLRYLRTELSPWVRDRLQAVLGSGVEVVTHKTWESSVMRTTALGTGGPEPHGYLIKVSIDHLDRAANYGFTPADKNEPVYRWDAVVEALVDLAAMVVHDRLKEVLGESVEYNRMLASVRETPAYLDIVSADAIPEEKATIEENCAGPGTGSAIERDMAACLPTEIAQGLHQTFQDDCGEFTVVGFNQYNWQVIVERQGQWEEIKPVTLWRAMGRPGDEK